MRTLISIFCILCFPTLFTACKDDSEQINPNSSISILFEPSQYEVELGDSVTILPKISYSGSDIQYRWSCEKEKLGDQSQLTFIPQEAKEYQLLLTVTIDQEQLTAQCTVRAVPPQNPYKNAILTIDRGAWEFEWNRTIPFLIGAITAGGEYIPDILERENPHFKRAEIGQILPVALYDQKLYIISSDNLMLWKFNAQTMKQEGEPIKIATEESINFEYFTVINSQSGYLSSYYGGLYHLNLQSGTIEAIAGISESFNYSLAGQFVYDNYLHFVRNNYHDTEIIVIDPITQAIKERMSVESCTAIAASVNSDGCLILPSGDGFSSAEDFYFYSLTEKKMIDVVYSTHSNPYSSGLCVIPNEKSFIYVTPLQDEVFKFNYETRTGAFIIPRLPVDMENSTSVACLALINGRIYVNYSSGMVDHEFGVYNAITGKEIKRYSMGIGTDNQQSEGIQYSGRIIQYLHNQF